MFYPKIKTFREIACTAARVLGVSDQEGFELLDARLQKLGIPRLAVVLYVNWADHNVLTYDERADALGLTQATVRSQLQTIRKKWKHLFTSEQGQCVIKDAARCS